MNTFQLPKLLQLLLHATDSVCGALQFTSSFPVHDPIVSARALPPAIRREARLANLLNFTLARGVKLSRALAKLAGEAKPHFLPKCIS